MKEWVMTWRVVGDLISRAGASAGQATDWDLRLALDTGHWADRQAAKTGLGQK